MVQSVFKEEGTRVYKTRYIQTLLEKHELVAYRGLPKTAFLKDFRQYAVFVGKQFEE